MVDPCKEAQSPSIRGRVQNQRSRFLPITCQLLKLKAQKMEAVGATEGEEEAPTGPPLDLHSSTGTADPEVEEGGHGGATTTGASSRRWWREEERRWYDKGRQAGGGAPGVPPPSGPTLSTEMTLSAVSHPPAGRRHPAASEAPSCSLRLCPTGCCFVM